MKFVIIVLLPFWREKKNVSSNSFFLFYAVGMYMIVICVRLVLVTDSIVCLVLNLCNGS